MSLPEAADPASLDASFRAQVESCGVTEAAEAALSGVWLASLGAAVDAAGLAGVGLSESMHLAQHQKDLLEHVCQSLSAREDGVREELRSAVL